MADAGEEHRNIKRRVSIVWQYFDKPRRDRVRCRLCRHEQNYHRTTGNLIRHLSKKHNIDATAKGNFNTNNNNSNNTLLELENEFARLIDENSNPQQEQQQPQRDAKCKRVPYGGTDLDPYQDNEFPGEGYIQLNEINYKNPAPLTAEEDCLVAQIDYFREKAAYYRKQKDLVALKATKIKLELEQLIR